MRSAVYAFGITMYELVSRKEPYSDIGINIEEILSLIAQTGPVEAPVRPDIPPSCPEELSKIIHDCWSQYAHNRPCFHVLAARARVLDLSAMGLGVGPVKKIILDMYPKHVSLGCVCVYVCMYLCMYVSNVCMYMYICLRYVPHTCESWF
jgi:hypothetical protein